nr:hypothetical protein [Ruania alba]
MRQAAASAHPPGSRVTSAALLVAVWPANMQMSADLASWAWRHGDAGSWVRFAVSVARLPLQVPVIRIALRAGRTDRSGSRRNEDVGTAKGLRTHPVAALERTAEREGRSVPHPAGDGREGSSLPRSRSAARVSRQPVR